MNKIKVMQWTGFSVVLMVALAISWYSMMTMATDFFGLPMWLAAAVSVAFDGAAIYVAILSSEYAKSEDSGLMARLATMAFVGVSAWLNWNHAGMMNLGFAGKVFFAAPPVIAGGLFELFLKFENRKELRKRGKVAQALPTFGKVSWFRYPVKTFKAVSSVILYRLENVTRTETQSMDTQKDTGHQDKDTTGQEDKAKGTKRTTVDKAKRTVKKVSTPTAKQLDTEFPELSKDMSIAKLSQALYKQGIESRPEIQKRVSAIKGTDIPLNTICKSIKRLEQ